MSRRPDVLALVFGVLFAGWALLWALDPWTLPRDGLRWAGAGVLIAAGVVGLVASVAAGRRRDPGTDPASDPSTDPGGRPAA